MTRLSARSARRSGYSLLEMIIAMSLLSVVMGAVTTVLRTGSQALEASEVDQSMTRTAHATVRHIVRLVREASDVISITSGETTNSRLEVRLPDGDRLIWQHDAPTRQVFFTRTSVALQASLLATDIEQLVFHAGQVDQSAFSANRLDRVQLLKIEAVYRLPRDTSATQRAIGQVWLRPFGRNRPE